jgi:hypothetical protein
MAGAKLPFKFLRQLLHLLRVWLGLEKKKNSFSGNTPGSFGKVNPDKAAVMDHTVNGALGDQQKFSYFIRPEKLLL